MIEIIWEYREGFLKGASVTFQISALVWTFGILGSIILLVIDAYFKQISSPKKNRIQFLLFFYKSIRFLLSFFIVKVGKVVIPSIPILVLLYWFHYPLQESLNTSVSPFVVTVIVLSIVNISSVSFIVKGIMEDLPQKYYESAYLCGLSKRTTLFKIELPLILRSCVGPVLLIQLAMLHNSIFASLINVKDILWQAKLINSNIHKPIEIFSALAIFFLLISVPVILLSNYLKNKYTKNYLKKV